MTHDPTPPASLPSWEDDPTGAPRPGLSRRSFLKLGGIAAALPLGAANAADAGPASAASADAPSTVPVQLRINRRTHRLNLDTRTSLLDALREHLGLHGTKKGCNQGACGACTVLMDGRRINACLTLAAMCDGAEIVTIEGLAEGDRLHPLQEAFVEHDAFQCGYCTPGQILSGVACIAEGHAGSPDQIRAWMSGNICRCGAYPGIVAAIGDVAGASPERKA